jgi:hypothetical protein
MLSSGAAGRKEREVADRYTRRTVLTRAAAGIILGVGLAGCAGPQTSSVPQAASPAVDPCGSDVWMADLVDVVGPAKQATWAKSASVDDGFCAIKAGMSIIFNQDPGQSKETFTGSFDIWVATDSDSNPHLHQCFEVFDAAGKSLFKLGPFSDIEMPQPGNYHHSIGYFEYPSGSYAQMAKVCRWPSTCKG